MQVLIAWELRNHVVVCWPVFVSKLIINMFQVSVAMQWCILVVLQLQLLVVLWLWLLVVLQLWLLVVVGLLIIDVGLMIIVVVARFLVSDRAPIVVGFSVIVIFVIVAGHVEWSGRLEQGGKSTQLHCNVIVEGGSRLLRAVSRVLHSASRLLGVVSHVLYGASRLLRAVSRIGSGFQAVSRCSAGRVNASGRFSMGYVEVSELTLITKMEGG